ncbi:hypothetical protein [Megasphaera sp.]|uniref:hypothetical protein n=1 Tax=Megasphaera sp. TaxID=2023260 RepID=UPI00402A5E0F
MDPFDFVKSALNGDMAERQPRTDETIGTDGKNASEGKIDTKSDALGLAIKTGNMQDEYRQAAAVYKKYQENIKKAQILKSEILIGAKNGDDLKDLLLKAAVCIGCLTGDSKVYAENMKQYLMQYRDH